MCFLRVRKQTSFYKKKGVYLFTTPFLWSLALSVPPRKIRCKAGPALSPGFSSRLVHIFFAPLVLFGSKSSARGCSVPGDTLREGEEEKWETKWLMEEKCEGTTCARRPSQQHGYPICLSAFISCTLLSATMYYSKILYFFIFMLWSVYFSNLRLEIWGRNSISVRCDVINSQWTVGSFDSWYHAYLNVILIFEIIRVSDMNISSYISQRITVKFLVNNGAASLWNYNHTFKHSLLKLEIFAKVSNIN